MGIEADIKIKSDLSDQITNTLKVVDSFSCPPEVAWESKLRAAEARPGRLRLSQEQKESLGLSSAKLNYWVITGLNNKSMIVLQPVSLFKRAPCLGLYFDSSDEELLITSGRTKEPARKNLYYYPEMDLFMPETERSILCPDIGRDLITSIVLTRLRAYS